MNPSAPSLPHSSVDRAVMTLAAVLAVAVPTLLILNAPPSVTFPNQAAALVGWGIFVWAVSKRLSAHPLSLGLGLWALQAALGLIALAAIASPFWTGLPPSLALSAVGLVCATALVSLTGAVVRKSDHANTVFGAFCFALVLAGAVSAALGLVQFFVPRLTETGWIAQLSNPSRVGANLRQPNHLSSLLLWSSAALIWLNEVAVGRGVRQLTWLRAASVVLMTLFMLGVVLTVSRTGGVCVVLLALWGVVDRRLSRFSRVMLWLLPLIFLINWLAVSGWAQAHGHAFAGQSQLNKSDISSSRFGIWENTLRLIASHPWAGVGWGEFNFAWTLTPFPGRPVAFFDHTHNLPLQFAVELGVPLAVVVLLLLVCALLKSWMGCFDRNSTPSPTGRCAWVMVFMMVVHSLFEYPLWYAYFLLPTAFAFGIALGHGHPAPWERQRCKPVRNLAASLSAGGWLLMAGGVGAVADYAVVTDIFTSREPALPLETRIHRGQDSVLFAHHAYYASATTAEHPSSVIDAFKQAPHYLLDTRLMMAWARAFNERGDVERARYLADRLREFHNPQSEEFFAECQQARASHEPLPFQCTPATRAFTSQDFRSR